VRAGVGRTLVDTLVEDAVARAAANGQTVMSVVAAARTGGFYERLGFVVKRDATTRFGPALRLSRNLG
jgi:ribosomal protein S18 acetylase RimI-like enzyme